VSDGQADTRPAASALVLSDIIRDALLGRFRSPLARLMARTMSCLEALVSLRESRSSPSLYDRTTRCLGLLAKGLWFLLGFAVAGALVPGRLMVVSRQ